MNIFLSVLTVLALLLALWQLLEARAQAKGLNEIRRSLSTRYIGQFPEYYQEIVALLERAKHKIIIFCDFPAYGSFTDPDTWLNYHQTLERKIQQGVYVAITCLDETRRSGYVHEQFFKMARDWNEWKQDPLINKKLQSLLHPRHGVSINDLTKERFLEILAGEEQRTLEDTFGRAEIREIATYMPLYFWLVDGNSAVFAIPSLSERAIEYGFFTTDQKLISAFQDMLDRYHREVTPVLSQTNGA